MINVVKFDSRYGPIYFELNESDNIYRSDESEIVQAKTKFDSSINVLKNVSNSIIEKINSISDGPNEIEVKLSLKFTAEAGAIIAKASTEGSIEVIMKWTSNNDSNKYTPNNAPPSSG